jgi:hypothetical protein
MPRDDKLMNAVRIAEKYIPGGGGVSPAERKSDGLMRRASQALLGKRTPSKHKSKMKRRKKALDKKYKGMKKNVRTRGAIESGKKQYGVDLSKHFKT